MRSINLDILTRLEAYIDRCLSDGAAPTLLEIEADTGIPHATAARYLKKLQEQGRLEYTGCRRMQTAKSRSAGAAVTLPVLGAVACGIPKYAEENIESYVSLPVEWLGRGTFFALRADGLSMLKAGIAPGDTVILRQSSTAEPGEIVVALVDENTATLKRFYPLPEENAVLLVPENDDFPVHRVELQEHSVIIQGVAVKIIKNVPEPTPLFG